MPDSSSAPRSRVAPLRSAAASELRRVRLREFQAGLAERLRRAQSAPLTTNRLGFQVGSRNFLVDLADAGEILAVPEITPVPLTKPWYRGLANVRGSLLGVVDLSLFADGVATPIDRDSRVLAFAADLRFNAGILVTRMLGLRSSAQLVVDAERVSAEVPWASVNLIDADGVRWHELDLGLLTGDERFLQIGLT